MLGGFRAFAMLLAVSRDLHRLGQQAMSEPSKGEIRGTLTETRMFPSAYVSRGADKGNVFST